ncbi:hypothetical protein B0H14DRAFT_3501451 [Mycena olivaceomarginata]|nr:hypothetical protein B0H14DRAFT_3501451 [Mycena olivaceomarginata]
MYTSSSAPSSARRATHEKTYEIATAFQPYGQGRKDGPKEKIQEFVILPTFHCAKVPDSIAPESAATVPDNFITSFYTLFDQLFLPVPTSPPSPRPPRPPTTPSHPRLPHAAGYTNVLATASPKHHAFLRTLSATHVFDYASATLTADVARAVSGDVLSAQGTLALLLPIKTGNNVAVGEAPMHWEVPAECNPFPASVTLKYVKTRSVPSSPANAKVRLTAQVDNGALRNCMSLARWKHQRPQVLAGRWWGEVSVGSVSAFASFEIFEWDGAFDILLGKPWLHSVRATQLRDGRDPYQVERGARPYNEPRIVKGRRQIHYRSRLPCFPFLRGV